MLMTHLMRNERIAVLDKAIKETKLFLGTIITPEAREANELRLVNLNYKRSKELQRLRREAKYQELRINPAASETQQNISDK